ncbi:hypothetical protein [Okeania sp. SIO3I5]|nr:hypothetical protein [Okeania sp. SIO3I5]
MLPTFPRAACLLVDTSLLERSPNLPPLGPAKAAAKKAICRVLSS